MKKLVAFIAVLLSSFTFACGFYLSGDDVRMNFINGNNFGFQQYNSFYYSLNSFSPNSEDSVPNFKNEILWKNYCKNRVSVSEISFFLKKYEYSDIKPESNNLFLKFLFKNKDKEAIQYLKFAKNCEYFNTWQDDPWEREDSTSTVKRKNLLKNAVTFAKKSKNANIKKRYAFLAMRLAFYNKNEDEIRKIYSDNFNIKKQNDVIDYWALYFRAIVEQNAPLKNYYLAKVFDACPEKRFVSWQYFSSSTNKDEVLKYAKNSVEKSQILMMYSLYNPEKNIENIEEMYQANPNSDALSFLLFREVSKLENWIFTPYYTLFSDYYSGNENEEQSTQNVLDRVLIDRAYAQKLLEFINTADISTVNNPEFWLHAKAELLFMTKNYKESLQLISTIEERKDYKNDKNLDLLKALNLTANQTIGNAKLSDEVQQIILKNKDNKQFLFAIGRELEYLGNTNDAAFLYSALQDFSSNSYDENFIYFKSLQNKNQTYGILFYDYFSYIDAIYTPMQLQYFINNLKNQKKFVDGFYYRLHKIDDTEINSLQDLLGTKYIRENKLNLALQSFQKLDKGYLESQDVLWEKNTADNNFKNQFVFDENPFYNLKYTPNFIEEKESFRLNKLTITKKLVEYINKANNPAEKDRDCYNFLVANCYYNMSKYGSAWMMRRYSWTMITDYSLQNDDDEFNSNNLAKYYYGKAKENSKSEKFQMLCLRMQGRCENNKLDYNANEMYGYWHDDEYIEQRFSKNKFYQELKKSSSDYEDLMSSCNSFKEYFNSRK
ncbi:hypothetical protein [Frigoriflavimonas asaccharolytica]|uniref:Tetratricopeptide repeat protein n=1 Tax=Frigoriflavimonas asaccharolytica TaxID=2735899 RepID=A0A8J8GBM7_9FLAO|nr:hypothetical protein [Frigoriflavimonas asaccharolytica]NRS93224.1 hypothetical protein [Frigoriflavimonas asaccharolytica]